MKGRNRLEVETWKLLQIQNIKESSKYGLCSESRLQNIKYFKMLKGWLMC